MNVQVVIITTDKRQESLASLLEGRKEKRIWEWEKNHLFDIGEVTGIRLYVLPTPISKMDKNKEFKEKLKEELIKSNGEKTFVFAGAINKEWEAFFKEEKIPYLDFMKLEEVVEGNAYITAEACVAEVLKDGAYSIRGQQILITGFGACGRPLAEVFHRLGAKVMVAARRKEIRQEVERLGYKGIDFSQIPEMVRNVDTVINTVPAMVLTEDAIKEMKEDAHIVDIASAPGGTDFKAANRYGISAKLLLGLPGIYTTKSSALLLKNAICAKAPLLEDVREEDVWIFQIVI